MSYPSRLNRNDLEPPALIATPSLAVRLSIAKAVESEVLVAESSIALEGYEPVRLGAETSVQVFRGVEDPYGAAVTARLFRLSFGMDELEERVLLGSLLLSTRPEDVLDNAYSLIAGLEARTPRLQMALELVSAFSDAFAEDKLERGLTVSIELLPMPELKALAALTVSRVREAFIVHGEALIPALLSPLAQAWLDRLVKYVCLPSMAILGRAAGAFRTVAFNPHVLDARVAGETPPRRYTCIIYRDRFEVKDLGEVSFEVRDLGPPPSRGVELRSRLEVLAGDMAEAACMALDLLASQAQEPNAFEEYVRRLGVDRPSTLIAKLLTYGLARREVGPGGQYFITITPAGLRARDQYKAFKLARGEARE